MSLEELYLEAKKIEPNLSVSSKVIHRFFTKAIAKEDGWTIPYYSWMAENCDDVYASFREEKNRDPSAEEAFELGVKFYSLFQYLNRTIAMSDPKEVEKAILELMEQSK